MKKSIFVLAVLACFYLLSYAEKTAEVLLRYSKQDAAIKIVLEAKDSMIGSADTIASGTAVRVDFPAPYILTKPKDFMFETSVSNRTLMIALKDVSDVKTYKLSSPARIVIEMKTKAQAYGQKPTSEAPKDASQQAVKPQQPAAKNEQKKPGGTLRYTSFSVDPGHGGYDYGIYSQDIKEKEISLSLAKDISAILQKKGLKVFLTRKTDQPVSVSERINQANSKSPEIFISLHATNSEKFIITTSAIDDTSTDSAVKPYKLSIRQAKYIDKSRSAANAIADAIKTEFKTEPIRRELPLPLLNSIEASAVMIEYPIASLKFSLQKERDRLVGAVLKGLYGNE